MAYLTKSELKTHIYQENIDEIIRNDEETVNDAIASAIDLAKSYLSKYDLVKLFGDGSNPPAIESAMLKRNIKDMACWYVLVLGNANVDLALFEKINDNALRWLRDVQKGASNPDWPYRNMDEAPKPPNGDAVAYSSNPKRNNHF